MTESECEELLQRWSKSPSDSEQTRAENAESVVTGAIKASTALAPRTFRIFVQGSYQNDTNVRLDSDVDICICLHDTVVPDFTFAPDLNNALVGLGPVAYPYGAFKNDVERALVDRFGRTNVTRGDKAFNVKENSYHLTADVVPCLRLLRYAPNGTSAEGISIFPDSGGRIDNWPHQQCANGVAKNTAAKYQFKPLVRIMKSLRNQMLEEHISEAEPIPSFLNECLVWNVPNLFMMNDRYKLDVRAALLHLWSETGTDEKCREWGEINEMKYLFREPQPWTRQQVQSWIKAAWIRLGFQ